MRVVSTTLGAFVIAVLAASCGGSSSYNPSPTPTPTPTPGTAGQVSIVGVAGNRSFNPNPGSMPADRMVTWANSDNVTHRIVANDGSWDTGNIAAGAASTALQLPVAGGNYHCSIHPSMVGVVNDTSGGTPPCTGVYC